MFSEEIVRMVQKELDHFITNANLQIHRVSQELDALLKPKRRSRSLASKQVEYAARCLDSSKLTPKLSKLSDLLHVISIYLEFGDKHGAQLSVCLHELREELDRCPKSR